MYALKKSQTYVNQGDFLQINKMTWEASSSENFTLFGGSFTKNQIALPLESKTNTVVKVSSTLGAISSLSSSTFDQLGLDKWQHDVLKSLCIKMPTPVQSACIPPFLSGQNVLGIAPTGSGKTAAFILPLLKILATDMYGVFVVILCPTRELAVQIGEQWKVFGAPLTGLRVSLITGGQDIVEQLGELERKPHVIIATPGRLADIIRTHYSFEAHGLDHRKTQSLLVPDLSHLHCLVLDEADRLLDPESTFIKLGEMKCILDYIDKTRKSSLRNQCQMALFTATPSQPCVDFLQTRREKSLAIMPFFHFQYEDEKTGQSADVSSLKVAKAVTQRYLLIPSRVKDAYLIYLLQSFWSKISNQDANEDKGTPISKRSPPPTSSSSQVIIFVGKCVTAELLRIMLKELKVIPVTALHSQLPQSQRTASLNMFKSARVPCLITTDLGARGLDIPSVDLVINYDIPRSARDYVHRVGRAGRAGRQGGVALSLISEMDISLVEAIEETLQQRIPEYSDNSSTVLSQAKLNPLLSLACDEDGMLRMLNKVSDAKIKASELLKERGFAQNRTLNKRKHSNYAE